MQLNFILQETFVVYMLNLSSPWSHQVRRTKNCSQNVLENSVERKRGKFAVNFRLAPSPQQSKYPILVLPQHHFPVTCVEALSRFSSHFPPAIAN